MTQSPSGDFDQNEEMLLQGAFVLEIGILNLDIVCYLEFGICDLSLRIAFSDRHPQTVYRKPITKVSC